jgi:hypothetical protein
MAPLLAAGPAHVRCPLVPLPPLSFPSPASLWPPFGLTVLQAILHPDAHDEGGLACNDKKLLAEMRE